MIIENSMHGSIKMANFEEGMKSEIFFKIGGINE